MFTQGYADTTTVLDREKTVVATLRNAHRDRLRHNLPEPLIEPGRIGQMWQRLRTLVGLHDDAS